MSKKTITQIQALCKAKNGKAFREKNGNLYEYYHIVDVINFDEGCYLFIANYLLSGEVRVANEYYITISPSSYEMFFDDLKPVKKEAFLKIKKEVLSGMGTCKTIIKNYSK